jgi:hypothetical protein
MAYTVTTTAGATVATIQDGTVNTTATSLTLIGKNYAGYGIFLNENYVTLLENFSNSTPPSAPLTGQLWYDNVNDVLKVFNAASNIWKPISSSISQSTAPSAAVSVTGDIWWDTTNAQLKVWSGSAWITIGPSYTSTAGTSGAVVETILDQTATPHVVVKFYISNSAIAILSKDTPAFTPQTPISGFTSIVPGLNLISSTTLTGAQFTGATSGASTLGGYTASQFLLKDTAQSTTGKLTLSGGLLVGSDLNFDTSSGTDAFIGPTGTNNKNLQLQVQTNGVAGTVLNFTAATKLATFAGAVTSTGNLSALSYSIFSNSLLPAVNGGVNIGASTFKFGNVYANYLVGTSVTAQYADLAERFESDTAYPAGTVVALGGAKEITAAADDLSEDVFGVISTKAAFLMNGDAGNDQTHPPIAVNGRVPVRVTGQVKKGDRLVSAGAGLARAAMRTEITAFNVIGRSLQNKTTDGEGTVEAIVKLNS